LVGHASESVRVFFRNCSFRDILQDLNEDSPTLRRSALWKFRHQGKNNWGFEPTSLCLFDERIIGWNDVTGPLLCDLATIAYEGHLPTLVAVEGPPPEPHGSEMAYVGACSARMTLPEAKYRGTLMTEGTYAVAAALMQSFQRLGCGVDFCDAQGQVSGAGLPAPVVVPRAQEATGLGLFGLAGNSESVCVVGDTSLAGRPLSEALLISRIAQLVMNVHYELRLNRVDCGEWASRINPVLASRLNHVKGLVGKVSVGREERTFGRSGLGGVELELEVHVDHDGTTLTWARRWMADRDGSE
jgi:hypothetical protein